MAVIRTYEFSSEELEDFADRIKVIVLLGLIKNNLIGKDKADMWAATHTLIRRKKSVFRTISDLWNKEEVDPDFVYWKIVSQE